MARDRDDELKREIETHLELEAEERDQQTLVRRVARLSRNVDQPDHILANPIISHEAERRPGPGKIRLAVTTARLPLSLLDEVAEERGAWRKRHMVDVAVQGLVHSEHEPAIPLPFLTRHIRAVLQQITSRR